MLLCMTDLLGLILSTILVLLIELIESALEHLVDILRYINVYVLLLLLLLISSDVHLLILFRLISPITYQHSLSEDGAAGCVFLCN